MTEERGPEERTPLPGDREATHIEGLEDSALILLGTKAALNELAARRDEREQAAAKARTHLAGIHRTTA